MKVTTRPGGGPWGTGVSCARDRALIDRQGKRYLDKGLKYAAPTGPRVEQALVDDPLLLRTPIARCEGRATVGYVPEVWTTWLG
jgi:arsenate reductase-like glutaredoxin family protein